ncbi:sigma-54-dependent Fis family transcriptional regulator [Candidatus Poribacteria bacterium]|nr:sigma-54-dependent Fis family transcriptional regulator [Candidatus Poribacteria bacterium]
MRAEILIVDDIPENLNILRQALEPEGYEIIAAASGEVALKIAARTQPSLILLDIIMPKMDGFETCRRLKADPSTADIPVIFITAKDETESLVEGFRVGGVDYITKPFENEEVLVRVQTHLKIHQLTQELLHKNRELQQEISRREQAEEARNQANEQLSRMSQREAEHWGIHGFIGKSQTIARILDDVNRLQTTGTVGVLITGESGTGKELIARAIHFGGPRAKRPFIPVNCSAVPKDLAESEFFGHVKGAFTGATAERKEGAFTGATAERKGHFELADGGTLFLDEVGDMPLDLQAKLLRVLEDRCITPIGGTRAKQVNVRVLAATNIDLEVKIAEGTFRRDLYFRLTQFRVVVPPLRQRREDIPLLAEHFLKLFAAEMGMEKPTLSGEALAALKAYHFPGNVRELKHIIEGALIRSGGSEIQPTHLHFLPAMTFPKDESSFEIPLNLQQAEVFLIKRALTQAGGNISEAARLLGITRPTLYSKLARAGVALDSE